MGKNARQVFKGIATPGEIDARGGRLEAKAKAAGITLPGDDPAGTTKQPQAGDAQTIDAVKADQKRKRQRLPDTILGTAGATESLGG